MWNGLQWMGREDVILRENENTQLHRSMQELQCDISFSSVASQLAGKTPKFSGYSTQKGEVTFEQWVFEVRSVV